VEENGNTLGDALSQKEFGVESSQESPVQEFSQASDQISQEEGNTSKENAVEDQADEPISSQANISSESNQGVDLQHQIAEDKVAQESIHSEVASEAKQELAAPELMAETVQGDATASSSEGIMSQNEAHVPVQVENHQAEHVTMEHSQVEPAAEQHVSPQIEKTAHSTRAEEHVQPLAQHEIEHAAWFSHETSSAVQSDYPDWYGGFSEGISQYASSDDPEEKPADAWGDEDANGDPSSAKTNAQDDMGTRAKPNWEDDSRKKAQDSGNTPFLVDTVMDLPFSDQCDERDIAFGIASCALGGVWGLDVSKKWVPEKMVDIWGDTVVAGTGGNAQTRAGFPRTNYNEGLPTLYAVLKKTFGINNKGEIALKPICAADPKDTGLSCLTQQQLLMLLGASP
jgi:hypothetical protein